MLSDILGGPSHGGPLARVVSVELGGEASVGEVLLDLVWGLALLQSYR